MEDNTKIKEIEVGENPGDIESSSFYNETNNMLINKVYVANTVPPWTVSVIHNDTKVKEIEVEASPKDIETVYSENTESDFDKVYVASGTISVISVENDTKIKDIEVGVGNPFKIEHTGNKIYASSFSTISVISVENDTKIKDIKVGGEIEDIESNFYSDISDSDIDKLYVANSDSDTISVISVENDTKIKDIGVGDNPTEIEIGSFHNEATDDAVERVYVANSDSDTISVISVENDTKIKDIKVEKGPRQIRVDEPSNTIYVANQDSEGISVIDGVTNKVVARVTYDINPSNAGQIICNGLTSPLDRYFYVSADTECVAQSNKGFEFSSWVENFGDNSTRTIKATAGDDNILESLLDFLNIKPDDPAATLDNVQFGNFTANFNKLPSPIPSEYLIPLYGIIITTIVGWSIPSIVSWINAKRGGKRSDYYHNRIRNLYNDGKLDHADIKPLNEIRNELSENYAKGKISEQHYQNLKSETGVLYEEIHSKRIDSLNGPLKHNSKYDRLLTINCWKVSPSSEVPASVEEPVSGELVGLDGPSNVGWA
jgi:YVTN family beta-propeller protein